MRIIPGWPFFEYVTWLMTRPRRKWSEISPHKKKTGDSKEPHQETPAFDGFPRWSQEVSPKVSIGEVGVVWGFGQVLVEFLVSLGEETGEVSGQIIHSDLKNEFWER